MSATTRLQEMVKRLLPHKDFVTVDGSVIPAPDRRWCGPEFKEDMFYIRSAEGEANRLVGRLGCTRMSRILDVGCGQGRLAIGLLRLLGEVSYIGIDIDRRSIAWCKRHIEQRHPSFRFRVANVYNERYNTGGVRINDGFRFDVGSRSIDIAYLYSVFSHTTQEDMRLYLRDFARVLDDHGRLFFTTFVEEDVPAISINPEGYLPGMRCAGALHVVRYEKGYLMSLLEDLGYVLEAFTHRTEADGQSALYLRRKR